ncbi:hypothetical protein Tco_1360848 [Tanacetum coccineum]
MAAFHLPYTGNGGGESCERALEDLGFVWKVGRRDHGRLGRREEGYYRMGVECRSGGFRSGVGYVKTSYWGEEGAKSIECIDVREYCDDIAWAYGSLRGSIVDCDWRSELLEEEWGEEVPVYIWCILMGLWGQQTYRSDVENMEMSEENRHEVTSEEWFGGDLKGYGIFNMQPRIRRIFLMDKAYWSSKQSRLDFHITFFLRDLSFAHLAKVMAAPIISISFDSSKESVGSHATRVILFGVILAIIPVIPEVSIVLADPLVTLEVGTVSVVSPTGVLDLVDYLSYSDSDPSEDSLPVAPEHKSLTPSSEFLLAPVVAPPGIHRRPAILVRPGEAIPFGRSYRTHPNGPHSSSSGSSLDSSSVHSSGCNSSGQAHSRPSTRVVSPRLGYPLVRTPRCSEAFMRWKSAPLSTLYPPMTSESSLGSSFERLLDSSSPSSGPSRKRYRSPTVLVPSSTPADLLPPRKRFRDSYSPEDSIEEHIEIETADAKAIIDVGISDGVVAHTEDGVGMGVEIAASDVREDDEEFEVETSAADTREITVDPLSIGDSSESSRGGIPNLEDTIHDMVHYMSEVRIDRIIEIETTQRKLEARTRSLERRASWFG